MSYKHRALTVHLSAVLAATSIGYTPALAFGQAALEEVVVTARKREESLQETPVAVSAFSGDNLEALGLTNISDLTKAVPNVDMYSGNGTTGNGNVFSDAPGLGALANNGGPTLTMLPQPGSPALGAGNVALIPAGVTTDQRGVGYARVVNGSLDIGSVEAAAAPAAAATPAPALSRWPMLMLGGLLALFGLRKRRRTG